MAKKTINRYMNPRNENDATCIFPIILLYSKTETK